MKKTVKNNPHVVIYPRTQLYGFILSDEEDVCKEILGQVKRHVDNVQSAGIEYETEITCEFCGRPWTEKSDKFNGGCCDKDMENEPYYEN